MALTVEMGGGKCIDRTSPMDGLDLNSLSLKPPHSFFLWLEVSVFFGVPMVRAFLGLKPAAGFGRRRLA